jgi:hypothetical protein
LLTAGQYSEREFKLKTSAASLMGHAMKARSVDKSNQDFGSGTGVTELTPSRLSVIRTSATSRINSLGRHRTIKVSAK